MSKPPTGDALAAALAQIRSDDVATQNQGVDALIQIGKPGISSLLSMLDEGSGNRSQVMYVLSQIAPQEAAPAFERGLQDSDQNVRAYAAKGLVRLNHPNAVAACIKTLNDAPDILHADMTPSVWSLAEIGQSSVPAILDLLMHDDENTRLHAQRALEMIVSRRHGFRPGQGFPTSDSEKQAWSEWQKNGNYDYAADASARELAVAQLRNWLDPLSNP